MHKNREGNIEMAATDAFTLSARVPNKVADEFKALADSLGLTPNALIKDMVIRAVEGGPQKGQKPQETVAFQDEQVPRLWAVALNLVDDLQDAGYPDGEIEQALKDIRREKL